MANLQELRLAKTDILFRHGCSAQRLIKAMRGIIC
jgi:hypothetical protein